MNQVLVCDEGPAYVLGVDAGGTRTRAVLADAADGRPLAEGASGPGNALTVPVERVTAHLTEAIGAALRGAAVPGRVVAVAGGFAGAASVRAAPPGREAGDAEDAGEGTSNGSTRADAPAPQDPAEEPGRRHARAALTAALAHLGVPLPPITIHSDIEAAFAGAPGHPAAGLALIAGTGSVAARVEGRVLVATSGGDGWLLGDEGSGFWIGRRAVRAALRAADGRGEPTTLVTSVGRALGIPQALLPPQTSDHLASPHPSSPWPLSHRAAYRAHLLPAVMERRPTDLAAHAPLVTRAADDGDEVARQILREAAAALVETVAALSPRPGEPLVVTGGLLAPAGPLLTPLTEHLAPLGLTIAPVTDGSAGAVALARLAAKR
nr:BadF/BadG/BcrA/BcrD ATPase family protein [Streptomyces roseirectus]